MTWLPNPARDHALDLLARPARRPGLPPRAGRVRPDQAGRPPGARGRARRRPGAGQGRVAPARPAGVQESRRVLGDPPRPARPAPQRRGRRERESGDPGGGDRRQPRPRGGQVLAPARSSRPDLRPGRRAPRRRPGDPRRRRRRHARCRPTTTRPSGPPPATPPTPAGSSCRTRPGTATRRCPAGSWPATPRSSGSSTTSSPTSGSSSPTWCSCPTGVGSLLQAALHPLPRAMTGADPAVVVSVEPVDAACVQASIAAGHPVSVATGRHDHGRPQLRHRVQPRLAVDPPRSRCRRHRHRRPGDLGRPGPRCERRPRRTVRRGPARRSSDTRGDRPADARPLGHQVSARTTLLLIATEGESANPVALPSTSGA